MCPRRSVSGALAAMLAFVGCNDATIASENQRPTVLILDPSDGAIVRDDEPLRLRGTASDRGTTPADLRVIWTSSVSGTLLDLHPDEEGVTEILLPTPAVGQHQIVLRAVDPLGLDEEASITLTVAADLPPTCLITTPGPGERLDLPGPFVAQAQVGDDRTAPDELTVSWTDGDGNTLGEASADPQGVASVDLDLPPGPVTITLLVADEAGQTCQDEVSNTVNGRPSPPVVHISPQAGNAQEGIELIVDVPAGDDGVGPLVSEYEWWRDGVLQPAWSSETVDASALLRDETWEGCLRAVDEFGLAGDWACAETTIVDAPPSAPILEITPAAPTQSWDLVCTVTSPGVDPDLGDVVTTSFAWWLDGLPTAWTGPTLPHSATEAGEDWTCVGTPNDGTVEGGAGEVTVTILEGCTSLSFDGGPAVTVPDAPDLDLDVGDFTVEAWVRRENAAAGEEAITCKRDSGGDGWFLGTQGGALRWDDGANTLDGGALPPDGLWHHVALTRAAGTGSTALWLDGALVTSGLRSAPLGTAAALGLGACDDGSAGWIGGLDDLRVSSALRYVATFLPEAPLSAVGATVALWSLEEGAGTVVHDEGPAGNDGGFGSADASWSTDSSCDVNLAPSAPTVSLSADHPLVGDDLLCEIDSAAIDPEGVPLSYAGRWWVDGVPAGPTFSALPATLPGSVPQEGEAWTCEAWASDGVRQGPSAQATVFVGSEPVCDFSVLAATTATASCSFLAPIEGRLRFTMDNPDASRDGVFLVDAGTWGTTRIGTGFRAWSYAGNTVSGWSTWDVEWNLDPGMGNVTLALSYDPSFGPDGDGTDLLSVDFVYGGTLDTNAATLLLESVAVPTQNTVHQTSLSFPNDQRLLVEAVACGFGGGAQGLYGDTNSTPGDDGFFRMDTGWPETCALPLRSIPWDPGQVTFTVGNEDDYFADNTGTRTLRIWRTGL